MPFEIYLARHGETDWNAAGRWQGHTDVPLNVTGVAQALALARRLHALGVSIASVVASDLTRARATAETVARSLDLELAYTDPDLRERRFGVFEGLTRAEVLERYPAEWAVYAADPRTAPPGGEPQEALVARVRAALLRVAERASSFARPASGGYATSSARPASGGYATSSARPASGGYATSSALVVSHGGAIRAIVGLVRGEPVPPVPNAGLYRIVVDAGQIARATFVQEG
jgi:probable phosphoglycerate mutase